MRCFMKGLPTIDRVCVCVCVCVCNSVPGPVTGFRVVNRTMSEMSVTWKQPAVINGDLTGYQLMLTGTIVFIHSKKLQHGNQVKIKKNERHE